jgi:protein gp37
MGVKTGIEWTEATWNPIRGCSKVSDGCRNCYAMHVASRFSDSDQAYHGLALRNPPRWTGKIQVVPAHLDDPLKWKRPRRIFVNSMSDLFHEHIPFSEIDRIFNVMYLAKHHTFQILTKRPERMYDYILRSAWLSNNPLPNVWFGVSAEDQDTWDHRVGILHQIPAAVRWVSVEPMLGPIHASNDLILWRCSDCEVEDLHHPSDSQYFEFCRDEAIEQKPAIDWIVVGGESGNGARPMNPDWARSIRDQCIEAKVPFLFKQWGEWAPWDFDSWEPESFKKTQLDIYYGPYHSSDDIVQHVYRVGKKTAGRMLDGRTWDEYPEVTQ